jgi:hypothetical protein
LGKGLRMGEEEHRELLIHIEKNEWSWNAPKEKKRLKEGEKIMIDWCRVVGGVVTGYY